MIYFSILINLNDDKNSYSNDFNDYQNFIFEFAIVFSFVFSLLLTRFWLKVGPFFKIDFKGAGAGVEDLVVCVEEGLVCAGVEALVVCVEKDFVCDDVVPVVLSVPLTSKESSSSSSTGMCKPSLFGCLSLLSFKGYMNHRQ